MRDFMATTKALADETRVRILLALRGRELCVCQITELLGLASSTVSKHMFLLKQARLVECRKNSRWKHYRLVGEDAPREVEEAIAWVCRSVATSPQIRQDARRLKEILKVDPEELCKAQCRKCGTP